jgi:hypothetical protein
MIANERVKAVVEFGFTERQARFLVLVMRHAGLCLLRQYSAFAGIVHGEKTRAFFQKLVSRGFASAYPCRHNRGLLYHVHHFGLYQAIDEPNNPHRRPVPAGRIRERLIALDAVLADAALPWFVSAAEKAAHFTSLATPVAVENLPRRTTIAGLSAAACAFPDKHPIGIDPTSRAVFLYLVVPSLRDDFGGFLDRHRELLACLPSWTLRLVFLRQFAHVYEAYQAVVREEWESPLHPRSVEELMWYFERRREMNGRIRRGSDERLDRAAQAFERPRFYRLYGRWLRGGDQTLADLTSTAISDALAAGRGRVESLILPHRYDHLSPLVDVVGSPWREERSRPTKLPTPSQQPSPRVDAAVAAPLSPV